MQHGSAVASQFLCRKVQCGHATQLRGSMNGPLHTSFNPVSSPGCPVKYKFDPGGYSNYFLMGCAARGLQPLPISKDFSPSKNGWFYVFFEIFVNWDPFLRVFLPKNGWFYHFFAIFVKWDPLLRIFLTKMGPMSKDFWWKSNPFGQHIPVCLNMWLPPPPPREFDITAMFKSYREYKAQMLIEMSLDMIKLTQVWLCLTKKVTTT